MVNILLEQQANQDTLVTVINLNVWDIDVSISMCENNSEEKKTPNIYLYFQQSVHVS